MWESYINISTRHLRISLSEERNLILKAQKGSKKSKDEIILSHIDFLIFRIRRIVFPRLLQRFGEDLLTETILIVYNKIENYDLDYRDKHGNPKPVKFASYIWKRIDGFIIDFLKKELVESNYYSQYSEYGIKSANLPLMSSPTQVDKFIS
jgi:DNA-directed RNA polymerase specialized sigma subunit